MIETLERRRVGRFTVPLHLGGFELELQLVRLLELSSQGARIEHPGHLQEGAVCFVDLPPALGRVRLTSRVMWTRLHKGEQTSGGDKHTYYHSGLLFIGITPEQQRALATALAILKTAHDMPEGGLSP